jgi:hypothetical protein
MRCADAERYVKREYELCKSQKKRKRIWQEQRTTGWDIRDYKDVRKGSRSSKSSERECGFGNR